MKSNNTLRGALIERQPATPKDAPEPARFFSSVAVAIIGRPA